MRNFQAWAGLARMKEMVEVLRPELHAFRDENGSELLNLPESPLPPADAPAPYDASCRTTTT